MSTVTIDDTLKRITDNIARCADDVIKVRDALLAAGVEVINAKSYHGVSIRMIADGVDSMFCLATECATARVLAGLAAGENPAVLMRANGR